jgi:hypothetical protein
MYTTRTSRPPARAPEIRGTGIWPDTRGGWVNGRGDDTMTMLAGYAHMVDFFTGFEWWKTDPHDELVNNGAWRLADPGRTYAVYLPKGGAVAVHSCNPAATALSGSASSPATSFPSAPWTAPTGPRPKRQTPTTGRCRSKSDLRPHRGAANPGRSRLPRNSPLEP